jgi:catechol 2,3-dioxygenase-like lactoylglutathione lyase family enzyme
VKPKLLGINHVALPVGSVDDALAFYGRFFAFTLRGRVPGMAFVDMGDQFVALAQESGGEPDRHRHFGLVVDDKEAVRSSLQQAGIAVQAAGGCDFRDPWGNNVEVVDYRDIQFTKAPAVLRALGADGLEKTDTALAELRAKGIEPG